MYDECFHDMSLLFDDDGKVYLIYGGGEIWCVELEKDLSAVKPGTKRKLINNAGLVKGCLAEGSHVYKLNGYYYIFIITYFLIAKERSFVTEAKRSTASGKGK